MKRLNRKGFTLIELLAIIVILAIIMVVTIPTVLSSMGTAREEMFETSTNTVADWVEKQYTQAMMQNAEDVFSDFCTVNADDAAKSYCGAEKKAGTATGKTVLAADTTAYAFLKAAGVDPTNYSYLRVKVTNGRACVELTAATDGDFDAYAGTKKSSTGC